VLEEFYEVVIGRAIEFLGEGRDTKEKELQKLVEEMKRHPSDSYFRLKTILLENIYGVDIMAEAIEIARLRLFLTLVARLERRDEIEPLPDLDMNIKIGNTLVGCSTFASAESRFSGSLLAIQQLSDLKDQVESLSSTYNNFVEVQRNSTSGEGLTAAKRDLMTQSAAVRSKLDHLFASATGITDSKFDKWKQSHVPFHWFVEFPEALSLGGFDVVIGNPPYIKRTDVLKQYQFSGFKSGDLYDIFAPCMERSISLLRDDGAFSMIIPISFQFSDEYAPIRSFVTEHLSLRYVGTYSRNPSSLFDAAVGVRSTIVSGLTTGNSHIYSTPLRRWVESGREYLFTNTRFSQILPDPSPNPWPRLGSHRLSDLYERLMDSGKSVGLSTQRSGHQLGFKKIALYYLSVYIDEPPSWTLRGRRVPQTEVGSLRFTTANERDLAFSLLSGRLCAWWWSATGDDFHVTSSLLESFPVGIEQVASIKPQLLRIAGMLRAEQPKHPLVTKYAGKEMGNYDMSQCRHITDQSDWLILEHLGLGEYWPDILLADAWLAKATGERPGTRREWPFHL
jgi:hypothetical protein